MVDRLFCRMIELGYDRYRFDGDPHSRNVTCNLFRFGALEPAVVVNADYALRALKLAVKIAGNPGIVNRW